jgi:trimeric autotransporter adhesin
MSRNFSFFTQALAALPLVGAGLLSLGGTGTAHAQATPRITGEVGSSAMVSLPGQVHPWARAEFDRGVAPENLSGRMLLVLKRSPEQESALQALIASQQDPNSPNYHKWLTPEDFGKRFGVADSDVQTVTSYLSSQGMSVGRVHTSHMAIEVSATAGQIRSTFQTEIHAYSVAGKTYYANNSAPKIPSALHSVVSGFTALNNFRLEGGSGGGTQATFDPATHTLKPLYTTTNSSGGTVFGVSPADLNVIYGIPPANPVAPATTTQGNGGKNVNIGIIGDSDINVSYVNNYRTTFGLGANPPVVVVDGNDPGANDDAYIAYKQIELVSAVAPNATIYYYTSATTDYDSGLFFALLRAVADNQVQVLLNGFQSCEAAIGSGAMQLVDDAAEQAAAQGITFVAASGNTGAAGCEVPGTAGSATTGFAVNGYASSPYVTAVGGTDFYYSGGSTTAYWSATNTGYTSALSYIPEQVWNDSYAPGGFGSGNNSNSVNGPSVELASGGGPSTVGLDGVSQPNPMPWYQTANSNAKAIGGAARVIPDVSFFAGTGANNSEGYNNTAYMFCMKYTDCLPSGTVQFTYSGGTEASSAVFAGAVALALNYYDQANGASRFGLGNVNPALYSQLGSPAAIIRNDITRGTNELACNGSPNCTFTHMTGFAAGTGYDAATGLGSFNITSFVTLYKAPNTTPSSVTLNITDSKGNALPTCVTNGVSSHCTTHSAMLKLAVAASATGGTPTGDVGIFTASPLASEAAVEYLTLASGTGSDTWNLLPGGNYNVYARYAGDGTYAPSVSAPYNITVAPELCQMVTYVHANNIKLTGPTTIPYGSPVVVTVEPYSKATTTNVATPSGSIQVYDNGVQITALPFDSEGAATFTSNLLALGPHSLVLSYMGDASFSSGIPNVPACSAGPFVANITPAATTTVLNSPEFDTGDSGSTETLGVTAVVTSATLPSNGTAPAGTVTFSTKAAPVVTLIPGFDPNGNAIATASITVGQNDIPSGGTITATYTPTTANYTGSASSPVSFTTTTAKTNYTTTTTFYITDNYGTFPATGTYPTNPVTTNLSFPVLDSLTFHMHVTTPNPRNSVFLVYANGVLLTPATWSGGFINDACSATNPPPCNGILPDNNGNATFTIPQLNGYLALPSGQVQFTVLYDGWYAASGIGGSAQANPSAADQIATIIDDRTSADFSLQSDTTVNQSAPLLASTNTLQATYNLRLTSIYNFVSAYSTTPINLSCSVTGYSKGGVPSAVPPGLACAFANGTTTTSVQFGPSTTGFISLPLLVGAASNYAITTNTAPAQPATRWWIAGGGTTLACIFLLGLPARRRKWQSLLGACVMVIVAFGMSGCAANLASMSPQSNGSTSGGTSPSPATSPATPVPAGTYTVVVTATATTNTLLTHNLPVQVLVGTTN